LSQSIIHENRNDHILNLINLCNDFNFTNANNIWEILKNFIKRQNFSIFNKNDIRLFFSTKVVELTEDNKILLKNNLSSLIHHLENNKELIKHDKINLNMSLEYLRELLGKLE